MQWLSRNCWSVENLCSPQLAISSSPRWTNNPFLLIKMLVICQIGVTRNRKVLHYTHKDSSPIHKRPFLCRTWIQTFLFEKFFCSYSLRRDVCKKLIFVTLLTLNQSLWMMNNFFWCFLNLSNVKMAAVTQTQAQKKSCCTGLFICLVSFLLLL